MSNDTFDIAPSPLILPKSSIVGSTPPIKEQSVVAVKVKLNSAKTVVGSAGNGKVPKFHTIEPLEPKLESYVGVVTGV